jgi:hypothetical protein
MTSQNVKPFTSVLRPRKEVLEGEVVEAVNLANIYIYNELRDKIPEVVGLKPNPLYNPEDFLRRTYFSESMKQAILKVFGGLAGVSNLYLDDRGSRLPITSRVIIIPSYLGGGKTHLLATLYHISKLVRERGEEVLRYLDGDEKFLRAMKHAVDVIKQRGKPQVVAIVGDVHTLAPRPDKPLEVGSLKIYTPWGLLAYLLGAYDELSIADQGHYAPRVDELRKVLQGRNVLILIDEAVEYMELAVRLDSKFRGYSDSFQSFLRNLAEAVSDSPGSVLVVTLPAEYREGTLIAGLQHPEYVERVKAVLSRVAHEYIPPLEFRRDVVEVFKRRLFENTYSREVLEVATYVAQEVEGRVQRDSSLASAVRMKYGDVQSFKNKVREAYPFHPCLIEVLVNIASANPGLGLTRYLLMYIARLIRYIYSAKARFNRDPPVALITTWLIPTTNVEFRTELLRGMLAQLQNDFQRIYEQDVKPHVAKLENLLWSTELLSRQALYDFVRGMVSETIWLYTIPGRGSKTSEAVKLYPKLQELPVLVYDPISFYNLVAADVLNAINDLVEISTYLYKSADERLFYALVPDILKFLRERYVSTTDFDALSMLERFVNTQSLRPGRKIKHIYPILTDRVRDIEGQLKDVLTTTQDPVLYIYFALSEPPDELEDIVLVRNNVILLKPDYSDNPLDRGLVYPESFKRVIGSEPTTMKEHLKSLLKFLKVINEVLASKEYLREEFGEEYLDFILDTLKKMKNDAEKQIVTTLFSSIRKVVLGLQKVTYEVDLRPTEEEVKDLSSLTKLLEEFLEKRGVLTSWTWTDIYNQLSKWSEVWDSIDRSLKKFIRVGDLWEQLLGSTSVKPHLTGYEDFKGVLKSAYNNNLIAFRYADRIIWLRHPYKPSEAEEYYRTKYQKEGRLNDWERDVELVLKKLEVRLSDLEVISPRFIIKDYINQVQKHSTVKPGEKVVRRLEVYLPEGKQDFTAFLAKFRDEVDLVNALSKYPVVIEEETPTRTFDLKITKVNDKVYGNEVVEVVGERSVVVRVEGRVEASEVFPVLITLKAVDSTDKLVASVDDQKKTPASFQLELKIDRVGEFNVFITAKEPSGYRIDEIPVARVRVRGEVCVERIYKAGDFTKVIQTSREGGRIEVRKIIIRGIVKKSAISRLNEVLHDLGKYGVRTTGKILLKGRSEEIRVEFRNADSQKIARFVGSVGTEEDLDVDITFSEIVPNVLSMAKTARAGLFELISPLSTLVEVVVYECVNV